MRFSKLFTIGKYTFRLGIFNVTNKNHKTPFKQVWNLFGIELTIHLKSTKPIYTIIKYKR